MWTETQTNRFRAIVEGASLMNWQSYYGEQAMGHVVQTGGLAVQNFVSAAVGMAVAVALVRGFARSRTGELGNFWSDLVRGTIRILLPMAVLGAIVLVSCGAIQNFAGIHEVGQFMGGTQQWNGGAVASQEVIKELGTNGGGYFNANSAHPFENPTPFSNLFEIFLTGICKDCKGPDGNVALPIDLNSQMLNRDGLTDYLRETLPSLRPSSAPALSDVEAPIGTQEVWAAGVTYFRSRDARMEEAKSAGGGDFYERVYNAARPELFFKATPHRVVGPEQFVAIRDDATWSVPEPEFTLFVNASGRTVGYTIGNDMSPRDIEGENSLYSLPAKEYDRRCAFGPCIRVSYVPLPCPTEIQLSLRRGATFASS